MKSHSELQQDRIAVDLATRRLAGEPALQAIAIARFIVSHTKLAQQILLLLQEQSKCSGCGCVPAATEIVETMTNYIKRNALHDLGIALEWDNKPA
jgi:hypothetical protein